MTRMSKVVCVSGIDGSGKSMLVEALEQHALKNGLAVKVRWLRFNHFFTRPLLIACRLFGATRYQTQNGHRVGKHHFARPRWLAWLFETLQYWDAWRVAHIHLNRRSLRRTDLLILDRYVPDILVDISIATENPALLRSARAEKFFNLLPSGSLILGVQRAEEALLICRPESGVDPTFTARSDAYLQSFSRGEIHLLKNDGSPEELLEHALKVLGK